MFYFGTQNDLEIGPLGLIFNTPLKIYFVIFKTIQHVKSEFFHTIGFALPSIIFYPFILSPIIGVLLQEAWGQWHLFKQTDKNLQTTYCAPGRLDRWRLGLYLCQFTWYLWSLGRKSSIFSTGRADHTATCLAIRDQSVCKYNPVWSPHDATQTTQYSIKNNRHWW